MANPNPRKEFLRPKPWKKGQSGNPSGVSKKARLISDALAELIEEKGASRHLAAVWLKQALAADPVFFKELLNRLEGKVPDIIQNGDGDEDKRIKIPSEDHRKRKPRRAGGRKAPEGDRGGDAPA